MSELVRLEVDDESGVATLVLDNPPMNALSFEAQAQLRGHLEALPSRTDVRAVVVAGGTPHAFSAGAEISELEVLRAPGEAERIVGSLHEILAMLERLPQVTVAAVDGIALGGGTELALACTLRVVGEGVRLGLPEVGLGLIPGGGGTQRLPLVVGHALAMELVLTGASIDAKRALYIGLAHRVVPKGEARSEATRWAAELAAKPRVAVWAAKRAILAAGTEAGYATELAGFAEVAASDDMAEGVAAFLEKRPPRFTHR